MLRLCQILTQWADQPPSAEIQPRAVQPQHNCYQVRRAPKRAQPPRRTPQADCQLAAFLHTRSHRGNPRNKLRNHGPENGIKIGPRGSSGMHSAPLLALIQNLATKPGVVGVGGPPDFVSACRLGAPSGPRQSVSLLRWAIPSCPPPLPLPSPQPPISSPDSESARTTQEFHHNL